MIKHQTEAKEQSKTEEQFNTEYQPKTEPSFFKRFIKWSLITTLSLSILLIVAGYYLVNTQTGLNFLIRFLPEQVRIERIEGTISNLTVHHLSFDYDGGLIHVDQIDLDWHPLDLFSKTLNIETININKPLVELNNKEKTTQSPYEPWSGIEIPLDIYVNNAQLHNISVLQKQSGEQGNKQTTDIISLEQILIKVTVIDSVLDIEQFAVQDTNNEVGLTGMIDLYNIESGKIELTNEINWSMNDQLIDTQGILSGNWGELGITQTLISPVDAKLNLQLVDLLTNTVVWNAQLKTNKPIEEAIGETAIVVKQGKLDANGNFMVDQGLAGLNAQLLGQLELSSDEFSDWLVDLDLDYLNDNVTLNKVIAKQQIIDIENSVDNTKKVVENNIVESSNDTTELSINGQVISLTSFIENQGQTGKVDVNGQWKELTWPLEKTAKNGTSKHQMLEQFSSDGQFSIVGTNNNFKLLANAKTLTGAFSFNEISTTKPQELESEIELRFIDKNIFIDQLTAQSTQTKINVTGKVDEEYELEWEMTSKNIGDVLPGASGSLFSKGTLSGLIDKPELTLNLEGQKIEWLDYRVNEFLIQSQASMLIDAPLIIKVVADDVIVSDTKVIDQLTLNIDGSLAKHEMSINSDFLNQTNLSLSLTGETLSAFHSTYLSTPQSAPQHTSQNHKAGQSLLDNNENYWQTNITELALKNKKIGDWALSEAVALSLKKDKLALSPACLKNHSQSICFSAINTDQGQTADIEVASLNLAQINPLLESYDIQINGSLDGQIKLDKKNGKTFEAQGNFESTNAKIKSQELNDDELTSQAIALSTFKINVQQNRELSFESDVTLDDGSQVVSNFKIDKAYGTDDFEQAGIAGNIGMLVSDLSILPPTLTNDLILNGRLESNITLAGSVLKPNFELTSSLENASVEIPELGLNLTDIQFQAQTEKLSKVTLNGKLKSGDGWLNLDGNVNLNDFANPTIDLALKSDDIELANTSELDVRGVLDLKASIDSKLIDLKGTVELTKADINFKVPESAVVVSPDVVLLGEEQPKNILEQRIDVTIKLGEKTHLFAQGLDTDLFGSIRAYQQPEGILRGEGEIEIKNGQFKAYGQDLVIEDGRIVFDGGSIDDPSIELEAKKTIDDITAGVQVSGRVSEPNLTLYSTPSMSDQDILSVLIFNKKIDSLESQDGLVLLQIANSLRTNGQNKNVLTRAKEGIKNTFGLTDLGVNLSDDSPNIEAGKQLSKKLYIGYGYGLLDAVQSLILRYQLNKFWSIKADLGTDSGADLRYSIER